MSLRWLDDDDVAGDEDLDEDDSVMTSEPARANGEVRGRERSGAVEAAAAVGARALRCGAGSGSKAAAEAPAALAGGARR